MGCCKSITCFKKWASEVLFLFFFQDEAVYKKSIFRKNDPTIESQIFYSEGGSRTAATSKIERCVIIVNGFQPLTIITKRSILDVAAALDPPLINPPIFGGKHFANPWIWLLVIVGFDAKKIWWTEVLQYGNLNWGNINFV